MGRGVSQLTRISASIVIDGSGSAPSNSPPEWTGQTSFSFTRGLPASIALDPTYVTDPDGDDLTFALASGTLPNGVTLTSDGVLYYDGSGSGDETANITIDADDGY